MQNTSPIWKWLWEDGDKNLPSADYSGDVVSFDNPGYTYPKDITIGIEPVQDLHGYDNPWPAGGGKNKLPSFTGTTYEHNGVTFTVQSDGTIKTTGTASATAFWRQSVEIKAGSYLLSGGIDSQNFVGLWDYDSNSYVVTAGASDRAVTFADDTTVGVTCRVNTGSGNNFIFKPMLRLSTVPDATFAPYSNICPISGRTGCNISHSGEDTSDPTVIHISWQSEAGTVYGGTLDVTTGLLTVEYAKITFDGTQKINKNTDSLMRYYNTIFADGYFTSDNKVVSSWLKNSYTTADTNPRFYQSNGTGNHNIYFVNLNKIDATLVTVDAVKAYFANNPLEVVYKLATPQTYQLTPTQIALLEGVNNIWADCGDVTVSLESPMDVKLEAKAIIAGVEYTDISAPVINRALMQGGLSIGNVVSASCNFTIRTDDTIPRSAEVQIKMRFTDGEESSEWLPAGTFYISHRTRDAVTGLVSLECFDSLMKANANPPKTFPWTDEQNNIITDENDNPIYFDSAYPRQMNGLAADIAYALGVELDSRTTIRTGSIYYIDEPDDGTTINEILSKIGTANGGNWIITPENKLRLVPVVSASGASTATTNVVDVDGVLSGLDTSVTGTITGIRCQLDDDVYIAGDDTGLIIDVDATVPIVLDLADWMIGMTYQSFNIASAVYDPAAELGDYVRAGVNHEVSGVLNCESATYGVAFRGSISSPDLGEVSDEFPYLGGVTKALQIAKAYARNVVEKYDQLLDQESIFNKLTDNGVAQGMYIIDGQLYINMTYARSGTLVLGGLNNQNGLLKVLDASGNEIGHWGYDGIILNKGAINLNNNFVVNENGDVSTKTLSATDYVYVNGDARSYLKIPTNNTNTSYYVEIANGGSTFVGIEDTTVIASGYGVNPYRERQISITNNSDNDQFCKIGSSGMYTSKSGASGSYSNGYLSLWSDGKYFNFNRTANYRQVESTADVNLFGALSVGGTKSRFVETDQYSVRLLYCYETPSPMFGDVGEGKIGDDGKCYVWLDSIFAQTITTTQYQVFLQRYGSGECWVSERKGSYFVVEGTPGLAFGWEMKAKQRDFDQYRLEKEETYTPQSHDYGADAAQYINALQKGRIIS